MQLFYFSTRYGSENVLPSDPYRLPFSSRKTRHRHHLYATILQARRMCQTLYAVPRTHAAPCRLIPFAWSSPVHPAFQATGTEMEKEGIDWGVVADGETRGAWQQRLITRAGSRSQCTLQATPLGSRESLCAAGSSSATALLT